MRIAYIYTALTTMGGVDRILSTKANYFAEKYGYEVYIITDSQAGRPPVFPLSPKVKHIDLEAQYVVVPINGNGLKYYTDHASIVEAIALGKPVIVTDNPYHSIDVEKEAIGIKVRPCTFCTFGNIKHMQRQLND